MATKKAQLVIVRRNDNHFWTGRCWSAEYPNALEYDGIRAARHDLKRLQAFYVHDIVRIMKDYGMEYESEVV
jgi:hypothetical protein